MEINWTVLTYLVIGLFALSGFFKGWWKEAVMTAFLALLVLLLENSALADYIIERVNWGLEFVWQFLPMDLLPTLESAFNVRPGQIPRISASDPSTWLSILIIVIAASVLVSRSTLPHGPGSGYAVRPIGSVLGGVLGGLNGFIIMGLIREYLDGRNLPGGGAGLSAQVAEAGEAAVGRASSGVVIRAVDVPAFTLLDSYLPWILIFIGGLAFLMALKNRVSYVKSKNGFRKFETRPPYGYRQY